MAWMDDVISQLMWQMQLQQMIGGGVGDPTRDPFDYRTTNDNRDIVIPSGAPRWEGYSGTKSNTNISGEMMHPNAGGVFPQPRPPPAGDVVLPATEGGGIPYMPRVLPGGEDRRSGELSQPSYSPGPYGSTRISDVRSDPVTQLMLQMQMRRMLQQVPGGNQLPAPVQRSIITQPSYAEDYVIPMPETQQRGYDMLLHEHAMEGTQHQRDQELSDALNRDRGRYVRLPEEYGGASVYEGPMQRISAAGGGGDPVTQLMMRMGLRSRPEEDWEPPVPPSLPPQDILYQDTSRGSPAQNARRDMEIVATPRPPSENIDELIRSGQPGIADPRMPISRSDLNNAQFNFAPGYLRRTAAGDGGDPITQLMLQMQLQQLQAKAREARSHWDITQQLEAQRKYNYGEDAKQLYGENLASRFPSWGGLFDPRPMVGAIGRTFDPRPLMGSIGSGIGRMHDTIFPPAY